MQDKSQDEEMDASSSSSKEYPLPPVYDWLSFTVSQIQDITDCLSRELDGILKSYVTKNAEKLKKEDYICSQVSLKTIKDVHQCVSKAIGNLQDQNDLAWNELYQRFPSLSTTEKEKVLQKNNISHIILTPPSDSKSLSNARNDEVQENSRIQHDENSNDNGVISSVESTAASTIDSTSDGDEIFKTPSPEKPNQVSAQTARPTSDTRISEKKTVNISSSNEDEFDDAVDHTHISNVNESKVSSLKKKINELFSDTDNSDDEVDQEKMNACDNDGESSIHKDKGDVEDHNEGKKEEEKQPAKDEEEKEKQPAKDEEEEEKQPTKDEKEKQPTKAEEKEKQPTKDEDSSDTDEFNVSGTSSLKTLPNKTVEKTSSPAKKTALTDVPTTSDIETEEENIEESKKDTVPDSETATPSASFSNGNTLRRKESFGERIKNTVLAPFKRPRRIDSSTDANESPSKSSQNEKADGDGSESDTPTISVNIRTKSSRKETPKKQKVDEKMDTEDILKMLEASDVSDDESTTKSNESEVIELESKTAITNWIKQNKDPKLKIYDTEYPAVVPQVIPSVILEHLKTHHNSITLNIQPSYDESLEEAILQICESVLNNDDSKTLQSPTRDNSKKSKRKNGIRFRKDKRGTSRKLSSSKEADVISIDVSSSSEGESNTTFAQNKKSKVKNKINFYDSDNKTENVQTINKSRMMIPTSKSKTRNKASDDEFIVQSDNDDIEESFKKGTSKTKKSKKKPPAKQPSDSEEKSDDDISDDDDEARGIKKFPKRSASKTKKNKKKAPVKQLRDSEEEKTDDDAKSSTSSKPSKKRTLKTNKDVFSDSDFEEEVKPSEEKKKAVAISDSDSEGDVQVLKPIKERKVEVKYSDTDDSDVQPLASRFKRPIAKSSSSSSSKKNATKKRKKEDTDDDDDDFVETPRKNSKSKKRRN